MHAEDFPGGLYLQKSALFRLNVPKSHRCNRKKIISYIGHCPAKPLSKHEDTRQIGDQSDISRLTNGRIPSNMSIYYPYHMKPVVV